MRAGIIAVFVAGVVLSAVSQSADKARESESKLIALENAWNQAQLHHDSKALDSLVAEAFISTDNDGKLMNRAEFLADNRDPDYLFSLMANSDMRVIPYGDAAVVAGVYHAKGTYKGKAFDHVGRFTDTWVYQNSKWQCVASHTSPLKK